MEFYSLLMKSRRTVWYKLWKRTFR